MKIDNQLIFPKPKIWHVLKPYKKNYVICKRIKKVQSCCCKFVKEKKTN